MNLHGMVSGAIGIVNPFIPVSVRTSTGYTQSRDGTQVPVYASPVSIMAQVQELTSGDLRKIATLNIDGLNIQTQIQSVYINGQYNGIVRVNNKGGDLLTYRGKTWLTVSVLEQWPDWTKLAVVLQNGS